MGSLVEEMEKRNLKCYGHLIRMINKRETKQVFEAQPERRRQVRP